MISKQDIDLYLSQIKTDDSTLQHLLACMSKDLKSIIDENEALKIKLHTYRYAKARIEIENLQAKIKQIEIDKEHFKELWEKEKRSRKTYLRKYHKAKDLLNPDNVEKVREDMQDLIIVVREQTRKIYDVLEYGDAIFNEEEDDVFYD